MSKHFFRYYKPNVLYVLIGTLAIIFYLVHENFGLSFSIFSAIAGLLIIIDKWFWKYKPFCWMFWIPDLSGRFKGFLEYEYRDENCNIKKGKLEHVKVIHQTGSNISISSFTIKPDGSESSKSKNIGLHIICDENPTNFELIYCYRNEGSTEQGFPPHYGTEILKCLRNESGCFLTGKYFTERTPFQTKGRFIDLKKINNDLEHIF